MKKLKKKIFLITSNRSEYGILKNFIKDIKKSNKIKFDIIVTGSHLNRLYGYTINEIIKDENKIFKKIKVNNLNSRFEKPYLQSSKIISRLSSLFSKNRPELILVLGDRYEIFSAVIAGVFNNIPIAHIHGGEITEGSMDEIFRHSITKMSNYHFVATKNSKRRVIQLGESPKNVFFVGSLGVENIKKMKLLNRSELRKRFHISFAEKNIMFSYHPERKIKDISKNLKIIFSTLKLLKNTNIFLSMPNSDEGNLIIFKKLKKILKKNKNFFFIKSMGSKNFLSMVKQMNLIAGNSSSGIIEAPSLKTPTINIGIRQKGRECAKSIFHCEANKKKLLNLIMKILYKKKNSFNYKNPYEKKYSSKNIISILENIKLEENLNKKFHDL